jgi:hypothetical protein
MASNKWYQGTHSEKILIDNHALYLSTTGPSRTPGSPAIILESGLGASSSSWALIIRHLSPFIRTYTHDRAGLGNSSSNLAITTTSPPHILEQYASNAASDLDKLLTKAGIEGPFIVVAMSWGGIVAREFLERRKEDVVGMVMIECCTEKTCEVRPIDAPNTMAFLQGLDFFDVVGLRKRCRLTDEEWQVYINSLTVHTRTSVRQAAIEVNTEGYTQTLMQEMSTNGPQTAIETLAWPLSEKILGKKNQIQSHILGNNPLSVIKGNNARDYQQVFEAGVAAGNGTDEQREIVGKMIEGMEEKDEFLQKAQLGLSSRSRFVQLKGPGHLVILEDAESVVKEVKWVSEIVGM